VTDLARGGSEGTLLVEGFAERISEIGVVGDRGVILGEAPGGGGVFVIVDLPKRLVIEEGLGFRIARSPSFRYLMFQRFFPRFAPPEQRHQAVMLYDVERSRTGAQFPASTLPESRGLTLFPPLGGKGDNVVVGYAGIAWTAGPSALAFIASDRGRPKLVTVDLGSDAAADGPLVCVHEFLDTSADPSHLLVVPGKTTSRFVVRLRGSGPPLKLGRCGTKYRARWSVRD
jgi:hypothetical protein